MPTFTRALVRPPTPNFTDGLTTAGLGIPDFPRALAQHERYCEALTACGLAVTRAPADPRFPDATFVEDTAIVTARGAILARPGADSRLGEVAAIRDTLAACVAVTDAIELPGTVDGGDVCAAGDVYFIGLSGRTNEEGASQLAAILHRHGYRAERVDVRGRAGLLHLKSGLAWLGGRRLVAGGGLEDHPAFAGFEVVRASPSESYGANCVLLNGTVLLPSGHDGLARAVGALGLDAIALEMSEFRKMDGGLSCLSLRF